MKKRIAAISFKMANGLSLLETPKKLPANKTIGKIYATSPNMPKKKLLSELPSRPPIPKLLIKSTKETAMTPHKIISSRNAAAFCCWIICSFLVFFRFLFVVLFFEE